jgi:DNA modification methylase
MGSGTVAAVAARLGRNYCGSELSSDYLNNQAVLRIAEAETGVTMNEIEQGQGALFQ